MNTRLRYERNFQRHFFILLCSLANYIPVPSWLFPDPFCEVFCVPSTSFFSRR